MSEGLNPIEVGKKLHEHGEAEHEETAKDRHDEAKDRHSRIVQICEAVLLALVRRRGGAPNRGSTLPMLRAWATSPPAMTSRPSRSAISTPRPSTHGSSHSP
jgi:hypothetical protein